MSESNQAAPFLIFGSPLIEQPEIDDVVACMQSSWLGTGPRVAQFERDVTTYMGPHASQIEALERRAEQG